MFWLLSLGLLATPLLISIFVFVKQQIRGARSPLRKLPGPPSQSWLFGNVMYIFEKGQSVAWDEWIATYGKTFQYPSMFNVRFPPSPTIITLISNRCPPVSFPVYYGPSGDKPRAYTLGRIRETS